MTQAAPYPPETRAKGWRFELDYEQIEQSDTWALTPAPLRPWLLMLWLEAWKQKPAGSLPQSPELIAARIGMPLEQFTQASTTLLRGWWLADDGRMYHDTIVQRVRDMLALKNKERDRKAAYRARMASMDEVVGGGCPNLSHGTTTGQPRDSHGNDPGRDATGTRTGTSNTPIPPDGGMPPLLKLPGLFPESEMPPVVGHVVTPLAAAPLPHAGDDPPPAKRRRSAAAAPPPVEDVEPGLIAEWLTCRTKKRAGPITPTVLQHLDRERTVAGLNRQEAIEACVALGWQNFTAQWWMQRQSGHPRRNATGHTGVDREDYSEGLDENGNIL